MRRLALCIAFVATTLGADRARAQSDEPLADDVRRALGEIPEDPPPAQLLLDTHFFTSDEHEPERFRHALDGLGGVLVAVGPEQGYFYAGWVRPAVLVLLDFDQAVVDLHAIYGAFFRRAASRTAFLALWAARAEAQAEAVLGEDLDPASAARVRAVYRVARERVRLRLERMRLRFEALRLRTFVNDDVAYMDLRGLWLAGRVRALRGDLTGSRAMQGVAEFARRQGLLVQAVYLSNVERYFGYAGGFGTNLTSLPTDERSLILRAVFEGAPGRRYLYVTQRTTDFRAWLQVPGVHTLTDITDRTMPRPEHGALRLLGPRPPVTGRPR